MLSTVTDEELAELVAEYLRYLRYGRIPQGVPTTREEAKLMGEEITRGGERAARRLLRRVGPPPLTLATIGTTVKSTDQALNDSALATRQKKNTAFPMNLLRLLPFSPAKRDNFTRGGVRTLALHRARLRLHRQHVFSIWRETDGVRD